MKFKSAILTAASGSVGGATYSHNRGGMYIRARAMPVNPGSAAQQVVRNFMAQLTGAWTSTLTPDERASWAAYAAQTAVTDKLGDTRYLQGLNWFVGCNVPRLQAGLARVDEGPKVYGRDSLTAPSLAVSEATQKATLTFEATDSWNIEDGGAMLLYISSPRDASVNFCKGPYRFAGVTEGDAADPPAGPAEFDIPFPAVAGQKLFWRVVTVRADGRTSSPFRGDIFVAA